MLSFCTLLIISWNYKSLQLKLNCRHRHSPGGFNSKSGAPLGAVAIRDIWVKMFRDTGYLNIEKRELGILSKKFVIHGYAIKGIWDIWANGIGDNGYPDPPNGA